MILLNRNSLACFDFLKGGAIKLNREPSIKRGVETFAGLKGRITVDLREAKVRERLIDIITRKEATNGHTELDPVIGVTQSALIVKRSARKAVSGHGRI